MIPYYSGNGAYCYANSLHMCLLAADVDAADVPDVGFLECLTTMPFGNLYLQLEDGPVVYFSGANVDPDEGLRRAVDFLGWTCEEFRGDDGDEALDRLRCAAQLGPVLVGPVDIDYLSYNPRHQEVKGADHFVVVVGIDGTLVRLHDPNGYPCAVLPTAEFVHAWRADQIPYRHNLYTFRRGFHPLARLQRQEMIARCLPTIRGNLSADPGGPIVHGGVNALLLLASALQGPVPSRLAGHLTHFALPLATRRCLDAAAFMREAGNGEATAQLERKAWLFGEAQYPAVQGQWTNVATVVAELAAVERTLIMAL